MIQFNCPSCHVKIEAKPHRAGTTGRCPKCRSGLRIPDLTQTEIVDAESIVEPYELKGDRLGMSFAEFKTRHRSTVDDSVSALFCSGVSVITQQPVNKSDPTTGLVNCTLASRTEQVQERTSPTVAGVPTENLLYHFVDVGTDDDNSQFFEMHRQKPVAVRQSLAILAGEPMVDQAMLAEIREIENAIRQSRAILASAPSNKNDDERRMAETTVASYESVFAVQVERLVSLRRPEFKRLYQISAFFKPRHSQSVHEALDAKYGPCSEEEGTTWVWDNGVSVIVLFQKKRASDHTSLIYSHKALRLIAESREPGPAVHDL